MGRLFGTDGVRGVAGRELDSPPRHQPGRSGARMCSATRRQGARGPSAARTGRPRPVAVVGRDPRASGEFLEAAVVAGLAESGVDVLRLGVIPTPGVAYLTDVLGADFGVMLSASHNPAPDNGIKFFARGGLKLPDQVEDRDRGADGGAAVGRRTWPGHPRGRVRPGQRRGQRGRPVPGAPARHRRRGGQIAGRSRWPAGGSWSTARTVLRYALAPRLLTEAGADVIAIGVEPDGININEGCGSTSLGALQAAVTEHRADAGIAYDGDADRCLAIDAAGEIVDGDQILAILALALHESGRLAGGTVVATVMANLGFRLAMQDAGIDVIETPVGDRYLLAAMLDGKFVLGGEQSGHIIMLDHSSTGDGMLTSLQLLATAAASGRTLAELGAGHDQVPAGPGQRARGQQGEGHRLRRAGRRGGARPRRARRLRPGARQAERHRASRAGHGRGGRSRPGPGDRRPACRRRPRRRLIALRAGRVAPASRSAVVAGLDRDRGIGVDIVDIARLGRALRRTPELAARLFTPPSATRRQAGQLPSRLAGRLASPPRRPWPRPSAHRPGCAGPTRR